MKIEEEVRNYAISILITIEMWCREKRQQILYWRRSDTIKYEAIMWRVYNNVVYEEVWRILKKYYEVLLLYSLWPMIEWMTEDERGML